MKVGVIGAGYWGKKHVDEYHQLGHDVFVSDLSKDNLEFCKLNFGAIPVEKYGDIIKNDEIKCISICTPNSTHHDFAIEALNAGKNILIEKPIATNIADAEDIIRLANLKNLTLIVGHIFRFNNAIRKIKELIRAKYLGRIFTVNITWSNLEPIYPDRDILFDLGVHPIDIIDNIFESNPSGIYCTGEGFRQENPEFAVINYHLEDTFGWKDVFVNMVISWINPVRNRNMTIVGSEKTAIIDCVKQKIELMNNQSEVVENVNITPNNTIREELDYFLSQSENKNPQPDEPNGIVAKRIVEIISKAESVLKKN